MRTKTMVAIIRPRCINIGCQRYCASSGSKFRPFCSTCHKANSGRGPYPQNVTPYKTGICSNRDGHLGFSCPVNYNVNWATGMTEIDHIDGNDANNSPDNIQELCPLCHTYKGMKNGDYARQRTVKIRDKYKPVTDLFD